MARIPAAERRLELIDAAVLVIAESGVDGATTRRIAERAGAPLATLHYCFASKELLFGAVYERIAAGYREVLTESDVHGDVATTARGLLRGILEWYVAHPEITVAIFELINWAQRQDAQKAAGIYDQADDTARSILTADARAAGQRIDSAAIDQLVSAITALSDGFVVNWMVGRVAGKEMEIDLAISLLDAWMAANLFVDGDVPVAGAPAGAVPAPESGGSLASLASWVDVG